MKDLTAILFCGGRGSRLYPITDYYQKVMMPIGRSGKPLLEIIIDHLISYGIKDFIALVGYRHNLIRRYFGDGSSKGINLEYVINSPEYSGTGGALYNIADKIKTDNFLIYYTDILTNFDFKKFYQFHTESDVDASIWIDPGHEIAQGIVQSNSDNFVDAIITSHKESFINTGISILNIKSLEILRDFVINRNRSKIDLSSDLFPELVKNKSIIAYISDNWWIDIGNLSKLKSINDEKLSELFGGN